MKNIFYICNCPSGQDILMKVFSLLSLYGNLENFKEAGISNRSSLVWLFDALRISNHTGVGYCLFASRYSRTSVQINERCSTLSFCIAKTILELGGSQKEMKRFLLLLCALFVGLSVSAKDVKISVTPSDAKIYIDGNYVGDGVVTATIKAKETFIAVKCEKEGYITLETKIYFKDKRNAVSFTLRPDAFLNVTVASGLVNRYFTITVDKSLYTDEEGKRDATLAWKMLHQVILNYFEEIQTTDIASGFIQTPWRYKSFPEAEKQMRTRVSVKESNLGGDLTFQVKITSEVAQLNAPQRDESFQAIDRIEKDLEPMIGEFQARVGKL